MFIPARILRRDAERVDPDPPTLSRKQEIQRNRILVVGRSLMARHGRHAISLSGFAIALGLGAGTIRRHFPDLDALHVAIVEAHLADLREAFRDVPRDIPDRPAALRAAYFQTSRGGPGRLSDGHLLFTRDRHLLPEDEQEPLAQAAASLGSLLGHEALLLLNNPDFSLPEIEAMLASLEAPQATKQRLGELKRSPPDPPAFLSQAGGSGGDGFVSPSLPPCTGPARDAPLHETGPPPPSDSRGAGEYAQDHRLRL